MSWGGKRRTSNMFSMAVKRLRSLKSTSVLLKQSMQFEALEARNMLAAVFLNDNFLDTYNDYSDEVIVHVSESLNTSRLGHSPLVPYEGGQDVSSSFVAPHSHDSDAGMEVPRGRPRLNFTGSTFVADNGNLLRGPFASTEWGAPPPLSAIQSIKNLGANAIHLYGEVFDPDYVSGVPGSGAAPGYAVSRIDQMVQMTRDEGLYLVLTIGNGGNNGSFNYDYVMDFWGFYADRYKDETHVIFEIQNEPHAWSAPYPQAALDMEADAYSLIRSLAPDTPVLLFSFAVLGDGPDAVDDIEEVSAAASIDWTNAAVAFHGYAGHEATTTSGEHILGAGYPVFMTEFTASDWGTDTDVLDAELTAELERLEISWLTFQHIPPNFIGTAFTEASAFYDIVNKAGLSWDPDYGNWPVERGIYGNNGQPRTTTGLTGMLRIEAEHFDTGGEGVAYSDTDSVNQGGLFRPDEGVDLERAVDIGRGYHVSSTASGEWLEYTIFVTEPGLHDLSVRVASATGGAAKVIVNGEDKTGNWDLPNTDDSQNWTTVTQEVFLDYGRQKLRFEILTGGFNLNWLELAPVASGVVSDGVYKILNRYSALVLEADIANSIVEQNNDSGATNEHWNLVHRGAGQYSITSVSNGWSWNTFYDSNEEPLTLAPWGYDGHPDRRFILAPETNGYYHILVVDGGLSIQIDGATIANGTPAQQFEYLEQSHQQWAVLSPSAPSVPTGVAAEWGDVNQVPGDYDGDKIVDGFDFLKWQRNLGNTVPHNSDADGDGNGVVDRGDLQIWNHSYGHTSHSSWVALNWNTVSGATSYNVKRSTTSGGPYITIASGVTATSFSNTGLAGGTKYYYVVSAVSSSGEGLISAEVSPPLLHAHLNFDQTSGTTAVDATGNGWSGMLIDGTSWTTGIIENAVELDGTNDYVNLPTGVVNDLTDMTLATWVNLDSLNNWARLFDFGSGTTSNMFLAPQSGITGLPVFAITTSGNGGEQRINSSEGIAAGTWTHLAVIFSEGTGILYMNGVEVGRNNSMTLTPSSLGETTQNYIGKSQYSWDPYLNGRVDDFRIYDDALSASEVAALAATPLSPANDSMSAALVSPQVEPLLESEHDESSYDDSVLLFNHLSNTEPIVETRPIQWEVASKRTSEFVAIGGHRPSYQARLRVNHVTADTDSSASSQKIAQHYTEQIPSYPELVDLAMTEFEYDPAQIFRWFHMDAFN